MKKTYQAPKLGQLGSVADLTQVGMTSAGNDMRSGSVNPPGHGKKPV